MVLWLHDILPEGATATGLVSEEGWVLRASRWLERNAYRQADRIVVLSPPHRDNLLEKGVPPEKLELIYDPATRGFPSDQDLASRPRGGRPLILSMGNIGHTQGLAPLVAAFERSKEMEALDVELMITGTGVAAPDVTNESRTGRVRMPGLVSDDELGRALRGATLALVTQSYDGTEFNLPSKLMNFMAHGLAVVAAVNPAGEVARLVRESSGGWVVDSSDPDAFPRTVAEALRDEGERDRRASAAREFARSHFSPDAFGDSFDRSLREVLAARTQQPGGLTR